MLSSRPQLALLFSAKVAQPEAWCRPQTPKKRSQWLQAGSDLAFTDSYFYRHQHILFHNAYNFRSDHVIFFRLFKQVHLWWTARSSVSVQHMPFSRGLAWCETQTASSRVWTGLVESISKPWYFFLPPSLSLYIYIYIYIYIMSNDGGSYISLSEHNRATGVGAWLLPVICGRRQCIWHCGKFKENVSLETFSLF